MNISWMKIPKKLKQAKTRQQQLDEAIAQFPDAEYRVCPSHGVGPAFPGSKYKCVVCSRDLRYFCAHCRVQYDRHDYDDHAECRYDCNQDWQSHPDLEGFLADSEDEASEDEGICRSSLNDEQITAIYDAIDHMLPPRLTSLALARVSLQQQPGGGQVPEPKTLAGKLGRLIQKGQCEADFGAKLCVDATNVVDLTTFQKRKSTQAYIYEKQDDTEMQKILKRRKVQQDELAQVAG